jgi:integrase
MVLAKRLTDAAIQAALRTPRTQDEELPDTAVPGLSLRLYASGNATWTHIFRVTGEGGTNKFGKALLGKRYRLGLGAYPAVSLEAARAKASAYNEQAKRGINPKQALAANATAGGFTIEQLSALFMEQYVRSRQLDSAALYENAFKVHIVPIVGRDLAELLSREDVRKVMNAARVKRARPGGGRGAVIGGVEASRTAMRVFRHMYSWAIEEGKVRRRDNPCGNIIKHLPKAKRGETVLSLEEARIVWQAAGDCGYPFGSHAQLMLLTGCRLDEWASAEESWLDLQEALMVVPAASYKSDRVHVVPLVPQAVEILRRMPGPVDGPYILSSRGGRMPIKGVAKFFKSRLPDQIRANTGAPLSKRLTSHALRRTVATRLAELLGDEGDKLVKRVLGHSDGSVTAIYNRYGYVREMRRALELWANELTSKGESSVTASSTPATQVLPRTVLVDQEAVPN